MKKTISTSKRIVISLFIAGMAIFTVTFAAVPSQSLDQVYTVDKNNAFSSTNATETVVSQKDAFGNENSINGNSMSGTSNNRQLIDPPGDAGGAPADLPAGDGMLLLLVGGLGYAIVNFRKIQKEKLLN